MIEGRDREQLRGLANDLLTVRLDAPTLDAQTFERMHELIGLDSLALYSLRQRADRWEVDRWLATSALSRIRRQFFEVIECDVTPLYYNPLAPSAEQRNRVVDALAWIRTHAPGTWEHSPVCRRVLAPVQMDRHHQPRVLLCDDAAVLAWFGGFHEQPPTVRQRQLLTALIEPMKRRLIAERSLQVSPLESAALELLIDRLGAPAFVVGATGLIHLANQAGRSLLDAQRRDVVLALQDAVAGRANPLAFELTPIQGRGLPASWIALLRVDTLEQRVEEAVRSCTLRWMLTPRQAQVLALLVRGKPTPTIAATLGCTERAVELHITKLFDRAGVDGRSALVAAVLTS